MAIIRLPLSCLRNYPRSDVGRRVITARRQPSRLEPLWLKGPSIVGSHIGTRTKRRRFCRQRGFSLVCYDGRSRQKTSFHTNMASRLVPRNDSNSRGPGARWALVGLLGPGFTRWDGVHMFRYNKLVSEKHGMVGCAAPRSDGELEETMVQSPASYRSPWCDAPLTG